MNSRVTGRVGLLAAGSVVLSALAVPAPVALAAEPASGSVVTGHQDWIELAYENTSTGAYLTPEQSDVVGPQRAPFGTGSHRMTIGQSTVQTELYRTPKYDGTLLAGITRLEYSTFARRTAGTGAIRQPTYLRLNVDNDSDGTRDASLFFYPAHNGDQQAVANGVWQNWDVARGKVNVDGAGGPATTLAAYAAAHSGSTLVNNNDPDDGNATTADGGALALVTGGASGGSTDPQANGEYFVDRVIVGADGVDTLFDFGPNRTNLGATSALMVDPDNLQGWYHQAYDHLEYLDSNQSFVSGPGAPPAGDGSLRFALSSGTNRERVELFRTTRYDGTLVRDLRALEFSTFQRATGSNVTPQQPVYLRLSIDDNGNGTLDNTLFYYPANNGSVSQGAWQGWDAATGVWGLNGDTDPAMSVTLDEYLVAHPDAKIVKNADGNRPGGGLAFGVGGADSATQMNGEYFLDDISVAEVDPTRGDTRSATDFDLERVSPPAASVGNARIREGNAGAELRFPVTLSHAVDQVVSVDYVTSDGTATAGQDYRIATGTLTIPAGQTTGVIVVKVLSDKVREANEAMLVSLESSSFGTLADAHSRGTIVNDDTQVGLELAAASGHRIRVVVETLAAAPGATVKVFRVRKGVDPRVLRTELNGLGRMSTVLDGKFKPSTTVTFFATVRTEHGVYRSSTVSRTVR